MLMQIPLPSFDPSGIGNWLSPGGLDQNLIIEAIVIIIIVIIGWKVLSANLQG